MALAVVCPVLLEKDDIQWLQAVQQEHGPERPRLASPRFTPVFPTGWVAGMAFVDHVVAAAAGFGGAHCALERALART